MADTERPAWRYELALLCVVVIWGCNFAVMKSAVERVDALTFNALRFTLSVAFLGLLARRSRRLVPAPARGAKLARLWPAVLGLGLVGHVGYQAGFVLGLERTSSGTASLLIASAPLWTGLVGYLSGVESLSGRAWAGLALAFAGTSWIAVAGAELDFTGGAFAGNLLSAGAAACWGAYTCWNKPLLGRLSPTALAFWTMLAGLPFLWLLAWPGLSRFPWTRIDAPLLLALLYAGLFGTGVAYVLWNVGVRHVGPARTSAATYLVPVLALLVGRAFLDEPITAAQLSGGAMVVGGLSLLRRRP